MELKRSNIQQWLEGFGPGEWTATHTPVMTRFGSRGVQSDYKLNGRPILRIVATNDRRATDVIPLA